MIGRTSGLHVPISVLNQRLNRPLIGIAAAQNNSLKDALTVCQVKRNITNLYAHELLRCSFPRKIKTIFIVQKKSLNWYCEETNIAKS